MKQYLAIGIVIGLIVLGAYVTSQHSEPITVTNERSEYNQQEEVITEPEYPAEWLEEANEAKERVLKQRQLEADVEELEKKINELQKQKADKLEELSLL